MQKNELVLKNRLFDLLVFVLFFNLFLFQSFGTVAMWLLIWGIWLLLLRIFDEKTLHSSRVKTIGSLTLALAMATNLSVSSPEKTVALVLISIAVLIVTTYSLLKNESIGGILELVLTGLNLTREYIGKSWGIAKAFLAGQVLSILPARQSKIDQAPWFKSIAVGLIVGLPLVVWLVSTLSKADPVFATFIEQLASQNFLDELPARAILSIFIFIITIPLLAMKWMVYSSPLSWMTKVKFGREMSVITLMIVLVMGIFLIVQWPYVFASVALETDLSQFGVATYSEYVKKGFGDLIKVVVMVFGVAWAGLLFGKNMEEKGRQLLIVAQGVLGLEFVVFIISIFRRVYLYQSYHGLTLARMYGLALLILIVGLMVTMAMRYAKQQVRWVKVELGWVMLVLFGTIWINMESLIVKTPPTVNNRIDYVYLSRLSNDGYKGWQKSLEWSSQTLEKYAAWDKFYGVDERREVYYADLSMRNLAFNYHTLIMQYGTQAEIREYMKKVIASKREYVGMLNVESYTYLKTDPNLSHGAIGTNERIKKIDYLGKLDALQRELENSDYYKKVDVSYQYRAYRYPWLLLKSSPQMDSDDLGYFMVNQGEEKEMIMGWNRMLAWNPHEFRIYQTLRDQKMIDVVLRGEVRAMTTMQRIGLQHENERGFEVDISLDSPFLR